jgi:hypothetical protein
MAMQSGIHSVKQIYDFFLGRKSYEHFLELYVFNVTKSKNKGIFKIRVVQQHVAELQMLVTKGLNDR